jgi:hypothetical protein
MKILAIAFILILPGIAHAEGAATNSNVENCCLPCAAKGNPTAVACVQAEAASRSAQTTTRSGTVPEAERATAVAPIEEQSQ